MKSYTDIEQSKKLIEFLPLESADMYYYTVNGDWEWYETPNVIERRDDLDEHTIPAWSLAALLSVIPVTAECKDMFLRLRIDKGPTGYDEYAIWYDDLTNLSTDIEAEAENFVDACYKFVLKLQELKIL